MNYALCMCAYQGNDHDQDTQFHLRRKVHVRTGSKQVGQTSACGNAFVETFSLLSILHMKCTDVHAVTSKQLYRLLHYTVQTADQPTNGLSTNGLPKSTTCPSLNYTHCSQLLLIHRMVAYSNHSPAENKMATRAMHIRDAFMLPMEPLTVISLMEQGKED